VKVDQRAGREASADVVHEVAQAQRDDTHLKAASGRRWTRDVSVQPESASPHGLAMP
jgi:hypothetical protein